jgi:hypothetical protein
MSHDWRGRPGASWLFAAGSACFAVASIASQWASVDRPAIGIVFFVGSLFFTGGGLLQVRSDRDLASAIQFGGTLLFNVSTFAALDSALDAQSYNLRVWTPDVLGSACFLVSSGMAYRVGRTSRGAVLNLVGSIAFGVSAVTSLIEPSTAEPVSAAIANATTTLGAFCFLAGALVPERSTPSVSGAVDLAGSVRTSTTQP